MSSNEELGEFKWVRKKLKGWLVSTWKRVHFLDIEMESHFCGDRSKTHRRTLLWCKQNHFQVMNVIKSLWKSSTNCEPCLKNIRYHYIACDRVNFRQTKQSTSHRLFASLTWDAEILRRNMWQIGEIWASLDCIISVRDVLTFVCFLSPVSEVRMTIIVIRRSGNMVMSTRCRGIHVIDHVSLRISFAKTYVNKYC